MNIKLDDEEGVIKGVHYYLYKRHSLKDIETEILKLLEEKGAMPLSVMWRKLNCHLWEASAALRHLKEKGLVEELDATPDYYRDD